MLGLVKTYAKRTLFFNPKNLKPSVMSAPVGPLGVMIHKITRLMTMGIGDDQWNLDIMY